MSRSATIIGFIALLVVPALASASNGFLSENSRQEKNLGQPVIHLALQRLNTEAHQVYVNSCPEHAADLVVAPETRDVPPETPPVASTIEPSSLKAEIEGNEYVVRDADKKIIGRGLSESAAIDAAKTANAPKNVPETPVTSNTVPPSPTVDIPTPSSAVPIRGRPKSRVSRF